MKLFKKALVATAIFGAFGAQAADLTDAITKTSKQGLEVGAASDSSVRAIVREQLEAGDRITLVFGAGITGVTGVSTDASGNATSRANNVGGADAAKIGIVYGSGTYTISPVSTTVAANGIVTVVLEVNTGDPITLDSSFEIEVAGARFSASKATQATVTYSAVSGLDGSAKDTTGKNTGSFIVLADQYAASVKTPANGVIKRDPQTSFKSGGATPTSDTIVLKITDDQNLLSAANGANAQAKFTLVGDFTNNVVPTVATNSGDDTVAISVAADGKSAEITVTDTVTADGIASEITITNTVTIGAAPGDKIYADTFTVSGSVDASTASATNTKQEVLVNADAGKWIVDATIINLPYFPVGYEGLSTSVHMANETSADVDVSITAISDKGVSYSVANQADFLPKKSVKKISQTALQALLKDKDGNTVPNGTKLSVTFNIDAADGDVNAYAMSNETGVARQQLANSQQKGK